MAASSMASWAILLLLSSAFVNAGELRFSSLVGANGPVYPTCAGIDAAGNIYVAGYTSADGLPQVKPVAQRGGSTDAFLVKLAPDGGTILGSTYLSGSGDDRAFAISVLPDGTVYLTGWTTSNDFPVVNGHSGAIRGYRDAFVVRVDRDWNGLQFSSYFGGGGVESGTAIWADAGGVWVAGDTDSNDLPVMAAYQGARRLGTDGFLARFSAQGQLVSSTYIGGAGTESIRALAVAPGGEVIVAGGSDSFDLIPGNATLQSVPRGGQDGFVLRFSADAGQLLSGTFMGGSLGGGSSGVEVVQSIAFDSRFNILVGGITPSLDFPMVEAWQTASRGGQMGFVSRFSPDLGTLQWSTYLGGGGRDSIEAVAVDAAGRVYAGGRTTSVDLPLADAFQTAYKGSSDAFLMRFDSVPGPPAMSTYLGGSETDGSLMAGVNQAGVLVLAGLTGSLDFPLLGSVTTPATKQTRLFTTGFGTANQPARIVSLNLSTASGRTVLAELTVEDTDGASDVIRAALVVNGAFVPAKGCTVEVERANGTARLWNDATGTWQQVRPGLPDVASNPLCSLDGALSSIQSTSTRVTIRLALQFSEAFPGAKSIWCLASDASGAGPPWTGLGSFVVQTPVNSPPGEGAVTATSQPDSRIVFLLRTTDPNGAADVRAARLLVSANGGLRDSCLVVYFGGEGMIMLADDSGMRWSSASVGSSETLSNSQCVLSVAKSSWRIAGGVSEFQIELEFRPHWAGIRQIHGQFMDMAFLASPWIRYGDIPVTASAPPPLEPSSPINGSGTGGVLVFRIGDAAGVSEIRTGLVLLGSSLRQQGSCYVAAEKDNGLVLLASEDGSEWAGAPAGSNITLQNSLCSVRLAGSYVRGVGSSLEVTLDLGFKPAFAGPKEIWTAGAARSGAYAPWRRAGSYYVVRP